jgi:cysteine desulfurase
MEIYLDNHSGTKTDPQVLEAMLPYLKEYYGNPQSLHSLGTKSKQAIEKAREQVASLIGATPQEIYFTSCGSESNNLAIKGIAWAYKEKGKHIIVSQIEHFSVLYSAKRLQQQGFEVTYLPVDKYGFVSIEELKESIRKDTILVSIQHANPEIGTIQPIEEIAKVCKEHNIFFHTDAVATCGVIEIDVKKLNVDLLSLSGSQFYGPKGSAALYIKKGIRVIPQIDGGIQEGGYRSGLENVAGIVGLGKASEIAKNELQENYKKLLNLRDKLISELPKRIEYIYLNGPLENRLPNNVNISIEFIEGEGIFLLLNNHGIYVTSGSACASKALKMSHVLTAINVDPAVGQGSILMTLSKYNTEHEIDYILNVFPEVVKKLREISPLYSYFKKTGERKPAGPGTDYEHHHDDFELHHT